ncbi:MAG: hypothetical protein FWF06_04660 [Symbiobacteriaceae bacterium]|nr:hypothetical protein [Symbiobacteriaceae bacterium]
MPIVKMKSVLIFGQLQQVDQAVMACFKQGCFHPEDAAVLVGHDRHFQRLAENNPYQDTLAEIQAISKDINHDLQIVADPVACDAEEAKAILKDFRQNIEASHHQLAECLSRIHFCENALSRLEHMGNLDMELDDLFASQFLQVRFGRFTLENYRKLSLYQDRLFFFVALDQDDSYCWGVCFTVRQLHILDETDAIFSSLSFERLWVDEELQGTPREAMISVRNELVKLQTQYEILQQREQRNSLRQGEILNQLHSRMKVLFETYELRRSIFAGKDGFVAAGFIPAKEAAAFAEALLAVESVTLEVGEADNFQSLVPPTLLRNHAFIRPMEFFVDLYGLPGYHDLDPTLFLGITYLLLFGLMFGDVGQGITISVIGWFMLRRQITGLGGVLTRLGLSSTLFGFLYGSVFGYEHALDFLYIDILGLPAKPLEVMHPTTITQILLAAVSLGAALVLLAMVINIVAAWHKRDYHRAFLHPNGLPGIWFYCSVLAAVLAPFLGGTNLLANRLFISLGLVLPLIVVYFREIIIQRTAKNHSSEDTAVHSGFSPVEAFFELFEMLLSLTTNTVSFLRVGGFILSHAGMMAVVMILANMLGGVGSIVMVVIGNLFVMALEGMVCGIQVLRLQFYELFSRYYEGGGKPFTPVGVKTYTS